jgi:hypothetical protein
MALEKHPSWFASSKVDNHHKTSFIGNVTLHVCFDILGHILLQKTNSYICFFTSNASQYDHLFNVVQQGNPWLSMKYSPIV